MKKSNLFLIFGIIVIIFLAGAVALAYSKKNTISKKVEQVKQVNQIKVEVKINPASLNWEKITESAPWQERDSHAVIVFKNKIWVMGGVDATKRVVSPGNIDYGNAQHFKDVWSSSDGINWQLVTNNAPWGDRRSMQVVEFNDKMWLMGGWGPEFGYKNDIWSSVDGIKWKLEENSAEWPSREGHQLLVFQNKIWLIGGVRYDRHKLFSDVWYSDDGVKWVKATDNPGWSPRWDHMSVVFKNKLWTIGGMNFTDNLLKDIWSSDDGIHWSLVNENPPFESRQGFALLDYKEKLWVISRLNVALYKNGPNDVWYSDDGINWQKTEKDPLWTGREDVGVVIFNDKIWILGGMDSEWRWKNDVWVSTAESI